MRLFDIADAGFKIKSLLADETRLAGMGSRAAKMGHPVAAANIARDILKRHLFS